MNGDAVSSPRRRHLALVAVIALGTAWLGLTVADLVGVAPGASAAAEVAFGLALVAAGIGTITAYDTGERIRRIGGALFLAGGASQILVADAVGPIATADGVQSTADLAILLALLLVFYVQIGGGSDSTPG